MRGQEFEMNDIFAEKERLLNITLDGLEKVYPRGLYDFLHTHDRDIYTRIDEIEDQLNESFRNGGPIDEFKRLLREYWNAHMRAIQAFKRSGQPEAPPGVREARIQEREAARACAGPSSTRPA